MWALRLPSVDFVAAAVSAAAAAATFIISNNLITPFPPGLPVPPVERGLRPFISQHLYNILIKEEACEAYLRWSRHFKRVPFGVRLYRSKRIIVTHPADISYIISEAPHLFDKRTVIYKIVAEVVTPGLLTMDDEALHSQYRRQINPAFAPKPLRTITNEKVAQHAMALASSISKLIESCAGADAEIDDRPSAAVRINDVICLATLQIIADAAFYCTKAELDGISSEFLTLLRIGFNPLRFLTVLGKLPWIAGAREATECKQKIRRFADQIIRRQHRAQQGGEEDDRAAGRAIVDLLLKGGELSAQDIVNNCIMMLFAGHETTSNTLQFLLAEMARNPQVQARLFEELVSVMGTEACPSIEALEGCEYLTCVINETLRLFPAAPLIGRNSVADDVLPGTKTFIPKGTSVIVGIFMVQRDKSIYGENADEFLPERWEDGTLEASLPPCAFMPFSLGKRNCIGKDLALNELRMLAAVLVRRFSFSFFDDSAFPKRRFALTMRPADGFVLRITERGTAV